MGAVQAPQHALVQSALLLQAAPFFCAWSVQAVETTTIIFAHCRHLDVAPRLRNSLACISHRLSSAVACDDGDFMKRVPCRAILMRCPSLLMPRSTLSAQLLRQIQPATQ